MYKLYWSPGSASMLPHGVLEEVGAPYELHLVNMSKAEHEQPAYLALNPSGKVPAFGLPSGETISECAAIAMYIADQYPGVKIAPAPNGPKRGSYYQWMAYLTNTLQTSALRFYYPTRLTLESLAKDEIAQKAVQDVSAIWTRIETHLQAQGPYLLGEQFSVPDIFAYMLSTWEECCPNLYERFPAVKKLADLVSARPAIQKMLKANQG